jgi:hypothetical protein
MPQLALCWVVAPIGGGPTDPGFGNIGGGVDPGYGIPGGMHPSHDLPGGGGHPWFPGHLGGPRPDQGLPGAPGHPGNRPPGSATLPTHPIYRPDKPTPPGQSPGPGVWVVAYVPGKGFQWVAVTPGVPEKPVPGEPPSVDNTLPPTAQPKA